MSQMINAVELDNKKMLRGSFSANKASLGRWDPSFQGYSHIFLLSLPEFMSDTVTSVYAAGATGHEKIAEAKTHGKNLKTLINYGSIGYSGTPDLTLNTTELNSGNPTGNVSIPTFAQFDGNQFTVKIQESRGEPLRHLVEFWITAISDPKSPYSHMHGLAKGAAAGATAVAIEPKLENITAEILVVQTDQTFKNIQNYDLWQAVFPTSMPRSDLDWDATSIDVMQPKDIQFKGIYVPKPVDLLDKVKTLMDARYKRYCAYYNIATTTAGVTAFETKLGATDAQE